MTIPLAYAQGATAAKLAFNAEDFVREAHRNFGPYMSSFFTGNPIAAGFAGGLGEALDTKKRKGSPLLRSLGVGLGAAATNVLVSPVANIVAHAVVQALGLPIRGVGVGGKILPSGGWLLHSLLHSIPTGAAQTYGATKGRDAAIYLEDRYKRKS